MTTPESASLDRSAEPSAAGAGIAGGLRPRLQAAAVHLLISATVAAAVLALVYFFWYSGPLARISGVGDILIMLLAVDVTLGPLLTLMVFDRRKRSLPFDMACIATLQLAALGYGLYTVEAGRPHYLVFVVDRFEVVSRSDLDAADIRAAAENPEARIAPFGARLVAAMPFDDPQERQQALLESVQGGRDLQHFPRQYRSIDWALPALKARGVDIGALRKLNPEHPGALDRAIAGTGRAAEGLRYVPVKGPAGDAAMLVDAAQGTPLQMVDLEPWN